MKVAIKSPKISAQINFLETKCTASRRTQRSYVGKLVTFKLNHSIQMHVKMSVKWEVVTRMQSVTFFNTKEEISKITIKN